MGFAMKTISDSFERYVFSLVDARLEYQQLQLKQKWHTKLNQCLFVIIDKCINRLISNLPKGGDQSQNATQQTGIRLRLAMEFIDISKEPIRAAQRLMLEMVRNESMEIWEAITINGLFDSSERTERSTFKLREDKVEELACLHALHEAVTKSVFEFTAKALGVLNDCITNNDKKSPVEYLVAIVRWWQGRFDTITRTILSESFSRIMDAVMETAI
jgi:hypothetical protein